MNISIELDDNLGNYVYYLQRSQFYTSTIAVCISSYIFTLFYKHNVYHDNFRILVQALTISVLANNFLIFVHSYQAYKRDYFVDWNKFTETDAEKSLKGNIHICDKYSPIPVPLMFINVIMLFILIIERYIALQTIGKYEKLQFGKFLFYFSLPLWLFCFLLIMYDYFAIYGINENVLFYFCHSAFVQKFYWKFSFPYLAALPSLIIITWIFIKNFKYAIIQAESKNDNIEDYLSARFQMIENIRSNALLAIFSLLLSSVTLVYTLGLFIIQNPSPKTITFFIELANFLFSLFTIGFYISMIYLTPSFNNKIVRIFGRTMKFLLSIILWRNHSCVNTIKKF